MWYWVDTNFGEDMETSEVQPFPDLKAAGVCVLQMWVAEPSQREDLRILVLAYLQGTSPKPPVDSAVDFYQAAKAAAVSSQGTDRCVFISQYVTLRVVPFLAEAMVSHDADCMFMQTLNILAAHIGHWSHVKQRDGAAQSPCSITSA